MYKLLIFSLTSILSTTPQYNNKRKINTEDYPADSKKIKIFKEQTAASFTSIGKSNELNSEPTDTDIIIYEKTHHVIDKNTNTHYNFGIPPCRDCLQCEDTSKISVSENTQKLKHCIIDKDLNSMCLKCQNYIYSMEKNNIDNYKLSGNSQLCHFLCFEVSMFSFLHRYIHSKDKIAMLINEFEALESFNIFIYNLYSFIMKKYNKEITKTFISYELCCHFLKKDNIYDVLYQIITDIKRIENIQDAFKSNRNKYINFLKHLQMNNTNIFIDQVSGKLNITIIDTLTELENIFDEDVGVLKTFYPILQNNSLTIDDTTKFDQEYVESFKKIFKIKNITFILKKGEYTWCLSDDFFIDIKLEYLLIIVCDNDLTSIIHLNYHNFLTKKIYIRFAITSNDDSEFCYKFAKFLEKTFCYTLYIENMNFSFLQSIFLQCINSLPYLENLEININAPLITNYRSLCPNIIERLSLDIIRNLKINIFSAIDCRDLLVLLKISKKFFPKNSLTINTGYTYLCNMKCKKYIREYAVDNLFDSYYTLNEFIFTYKGKYGFEDMNISYTRIFEGLFQRTKTLNLQMQNIPRILYKTQKKFKTLEQIILSKTEISIELFLDFLKKCTKISCIRLNECTLKKFEPFIDLKDKISIKTLHVNHIYIYDLIYIIDFLIIDVLIISNLKEQNFSTSIIMPKMMKIEIKKIVIDMNTLVTQSFLKLVKCPEISIKEPDI